MTIRSISVCHLVLGLLTFAIFSTRTLAQQDEREGVPEAPAGILFERDIAYREGHERWVLNVIAPEKSSAKPRPAVLLVHGGGWAGGDQYRFTKMGFMFAEEGYVVILPTHRMYQDAPFPACLEDLKNAIRWTRANAGTYNVDPDRIGAYGNSAGGTQVLTAALTNGLEEFEGDGPHQEFSSDLQAVAGSGVVGDMRHSSHSKRAVFAYRNLATGGDRKVTDSKVSEVLRSASPTTYIKEDVPPALIVHGVKDEVVIIDSTDEFVEKMKQAGADITYLRYEDGGHAVMGQKARETTPAMLEFFARHL